MTNFRKIFKKQIPQKPLNINVVNDGYAFQYVCPNCKVWQVSTQKHYCSDCGQKLDWRKK